MQFIKRYAFGIYVLVLIIFLIFVKMALKTSSIQVLPKPDKSLSAETHPVSVKLRVELPDTTKIYEATLKDVDKVTDLFEYLRQNSDFSFEKTLYTYGLGLDEINTLPPPQGYVWKVFYQETDVTVDADTTKLLDGATYTVKLVPLE